MSFVNFCINNPCSYFLESSPIGGYHHVEALRIQLSPLHKSEASMQFYAADGTLVSTRDICNFENLPVEGLQRMEAIQTPFHSLHRIIYTLRMKYLLCSSPIEAPEGGKQTSPASRSASQRR